jgi:hypothetical protein
MFFHLFTLCSAYVSALVIVLSDSLCERIRKWETYLILKEDIAGVRLAGPSVIKTATLLGVSRTTVSKVMLAYKCHQGKTISVKMNSGQKSTLTKRDCHTLRRIVSKSDRTTAQCR